MMHLYLVRHGIAMDREDPNCPPDTERPLTPKGMKRTHAAALGLHALKIHPDAVLTSPWLRAVQTAEIFCEVMGFSSKKIVQVDTLKGTSTPAELFGIRKTEGKNRPVLRPRTASASGDRPGPAHQRENHRTEKSRRRLPGSGTHLAAARPAHRALSSKHSSRTSQITAQVFVAPASRRGFCACAPSAPSHPRLNHHPQLPHKPLQLRNPLHRRLHPLLLPHKPRFPPSPIRTVRFPSIKKQGSP